MAVLLSHCYPLTGRDEPVARVTGETLGDLGVSVFFAISGFLVARSWASQPASAPVRRQARAAPAAGAHRLRVAAGAGPRPAHHDALASAATSRRRRRGSTRCARACSSRSPAACPASSSTTRFPDAVDGSLWTLPLEACCYVMVAVARRARAAARTARCSPRLVVLGLAGDLAAGRHRLAPARRRAEHGSGRQCPDRPPPRGRSSSIGSLLLRGPRRSSGSPGGSRRPLRWCGSARGRARGSPSPPRSSSRTPILVLAYRTPTRAQRPRPPGRRLLRRLRLRLPGAADRRARVEGRDRRQACSSSRRPITYVLGLDLVATDRVAGPRAQAPRRRHVAAREPRRPRREAGEATLARAHARHDRPAAAPRLRRAVDLLRGLRARLRHVAALRHRASTSSAAAPTSPRCSAALAAFDPDVVVVFRPEIIPAGAFAGLRGPRPSASSPSRCRAPAAARAPATRTSSAGSGSSGEVDGSNFDRIVAFDPLIAATADRVLPVWRAIPLPVADRYYRPVTSARPDRAAAVRRALDRSTARRSSPRPSTASTCCTSRSASTRRAWSASWTSTGWRSTSTTSPTRASRTASACTWRRVTS